MEKTAIFYPQQQMTPDSLNNIGEFAREGLDHIVHDAITSTTKFWNFPVAKTGPMEVTVGEGRLYYNGKVYARQEDNGVILSLANYLPTITKKIVTIAVWGKTLDSAIEQVTFLVKEGSDEVEARPVATINQRFAEVNAVEGIENANPQPPILDSAVVPVAYVTLTPAGIASIEAVQENRIISLEKVQTDITNVKGWMHNTGKRIDTLDTDMTALASSLKGVVRQDEFFNAAADIGRLKARVGMPEDMSFWGADHYLSLEQSDSDSQHPEYLCKVEEGIRFGNAAERKANINLLNPLEPRVMLNGNFALPAYSPKLRLDLAGKDGEIILSQYTVRSGVNMVQKTRTRTRIRYGVTRSVCTNSSWWNSGRYDPVTGIFRRDGETWEVTPEDRRNAAAHTGYVRVTQFWYDSYDEAYWDAQVEKFTLNGTIAAQTWLNAQDGWLTHIDLFFSQIAKTGDIHVLITETDHGAPDLNKVLARVKIAVEDLKVYPHETKVPIGPVFVTKGRYALVLVTDGAHMACTINGNKYGQGQYFYSGDGGGWFMGDAKIDLAMRLYYAHFNATRAEVQVEPWVLEGGIGDVDILAESFVPEGCQLVWQIRVEGQWRPIASDAPNLLLGLNPLYEARLVFIGTTDLMPSFTFGSASSITTARARTDYTHISKARTMPTGVTLVEVRLRLEDYEQTNHTCLVRLMTGDGFKSLTAPSSVKDYKTEDPNAIERRWQFKFTSLKAYKIKITGTTKSPLNTYHVAERVDIGRTA